jgi:hypothetical protein
MGWRGVSGRDRDVEDGDYLETCSHADLELLHGISDLHDDTGAFVAGAFGPECCHWWQVPVFGHKVDV